MLYKSEGISEGKCTAFTQSLTNKGFSPPKILAGKSCAEIVRVTSKQIPNKAFSNDLI